MRQPCAPRLHQVKILAVKSYHIGRIGEKYVYSSKTYRYHIANLNGDSAGRGAKSFTSNGAGNSRAIRKRDKFLSR